VNAHDVHGAFEFIQGLPPDIRAAVKPFFTHFTAGRTTELATAHAVVDVVGFLVRGEQAAIPAQVILDGEFDELRGPLAVPVLLSSVGWSQTVSTEVADDERAALRQAHRAIESTLQT